MLRKIINKIKAFKKIYPYPIFKIVNISGDPNNKDTIITYQVSGKSTISVESPAKLLEDLGEIKGFSKKDSNLIYDLVFEEKLSPSLRIITINFFENPVKFEIEEVNS